MIYRANVIKYFNLSYKKELINSLFFLIHITFVVLIAQRILYLSYLISGV